MKLCEIEEGSPGSTFPQPARKANSESHCDKAAQMPRPMLRIVSQPFSPEAAGRAQFGFFASAFRARKAVRIARTGNNR